MTAPSTIQAFAATAQPDAAQSSGLIQSIQALRLTPTQADLLSGTPVLVGVAVTKPPKAHFFKVRAGEEFTATFHLLDASKLGAEGNYAVGPQVVGLIADQIRRVQLRLAVTSFGVPYLIPVPLPGPDGRWNPWHQSLARAAELAESRWIRISADQPRGAYSVFEAQSALAEAQWPAKTFDELLEIAFRDRMITSDDHPLVQQLLGRA